MEYQKLKILKKDNSKEKKAREHSTNHIKSNSNNSFSSIPVNSKKISKKKDSFEQILKGINSNKSYIKKEKNDDKVNCYRYDYLITQLIDRENDTYEDIKLKNKKLREIIVKVNKQLDLITSKYENIKKNSEYEKSMLLDRLEKISNNYKIYAESYKENIKLKKEKDMITENNTQINILFNNCKNAFIDIIKNLIFYYNKIKIFYENNNNEVDKFNYINYEDFIYKLKQEILSNISQYYNQIDIINFPNFYQEYHNFLNQQYGNGNIYKNLNTNKKFRNISHNKTDENNNNNSYDDKNRNDKLLNKRKKDKNNFLKESERSFDNGKDKYGNKIEKNFNNTHFHNIINNKNYNSNNVTNANIGNNFNKNYSRGLFDDVGNVKNNFQKSASRKSYK